MKLDDCPIYKATGKRTVHQVDECHTCPFSEGCPFDKFDKTVMEILKDIGDYLNEKRVE